MTAKVFCIHVVSPLANLKMLYIKYCVAYGGWFWYPETIIHFTLVLFFNLFGLLSMNLNNATYLHRQAEQKRLVLGMILMNVLYIYFDMKLLADYMFLLIRLIKDSCWDIQQSSVFRMHSMIFTDQYQLQ